MKKSLLIAILLLPVALAAAAPGTGVLPLPECFPCDDPPQTLAATNVLPLPECFPCDDSSQLLVAATNVLPLPECFPCDDPPQALSATNVLPLPECFPCDDSLTANIRAILRRPVARNQADLRRRS